MTGPHYDILVIGGGNAAVSAAITARRMGRSVLVLESAPRDFRGGNTAAAAPAASGEAAAAAPASGSDTTASAAAAPPPSPLSCCTAPYFCYALSSVNINK